MSREKEEMGNDKVGEMREGMGEGVGDGVIGGMMRRRGGVFFIVYMVYWMAVFAGVRVFFWVWTAPEGVSLWGDFPQVWAHGVAMDTSAAGYFCAVPCVVMLVYSAVWSERVRRGLLRALRWYTYLLIGVTAVVCVGDAFLYPYWGFRLDVTPLFYLESPRNAMASATVGDMVAFVLVVVGMTAGMVWAYRKMESRAEVDGRKDWASVGVMVGLVPVMVVMIRGGIGVSTMNAGRVYFSDRIYCNHAALNANWTFIYSFTKAEDYGEYKFMEKEEAEAMMRGLYGKWGDEGEVNGRGVSGERKGRGVNGEGLEVNGVRREVDGDGREVDGDGREVNGERYINGERGGRERVVRMERPNVVVMVMESFSGTACGKLGGDDAMPNLCRYAERGVWFENFYANSFRTDRGLAAIFASYPGMPRTSLMKLTAKTQNVPMFSQRLRAEGYSTYYYYGGDINFTNQNSFLVVGGFDSIVSDKDFGREELVTEWGALDGSLFEKFGADWEGGRLREPFLCAVQTSSSHEPFEVPYKHWDDAYLNSVAYADSCLGALMARMEGSDAWGRTLVIIVADHAARHPGGMDYDNTERFHIPMVWTGGAVGEGRTVGKYCQQTDIGATLLGQMGIANEGMVFGKDVFVKASGSFAFYSFNNGYGILNEEGKCVFDCSTGRVMTKEGRDYEALGKAYLQSIYEDLERR